MPVTTVLAESPETGVAATPDANRDDTFPGNWLEQLASAGKDLRLTLPNGQPVAGTIANVSRASGDVISLAGTLQHPEPGDFSFSCQRDAKGTSSISGVLRFASRSVEWVLKPGTTPGRFQLVEAPAPDAFRPRDMKMPTQTAGKSANPAAAREAAEETLRKSLEIEEIAPGKLRIGQVEILRDSRCIRIPATVNQREKVVEYALVTATGKTHESIFSTTAAPKDVHLAMILLGVKPAACVAGSDQALDIPAAALARASVEWDHAGSHQARPLLDLITTRDQDGPDRNLIERPWQYNGSRFNQAGFGATLEGSIIALMADDMALLNNAGPDRASDDSHFPNTSLLPPQDTPVTIVISTPLPASKQKPEKPTP